MPNSMIIAVALHLQFFSIEMFHAFLFCILLRGFSISLIYAVEKCIYIFFYHWKFTFIRSGGGGSGSGSGSNSTACRDALWLTIWLVASAE